MILDAELKDFCNLLMLLVLQHLIYLIYNLYATCIDSVSISYTTQFNRTSMLPMTSLCRSAGDLLSTHSGKAVVNEVPGGGD